MDIELIGRHALLFDDDPTAEFVNSKEGLVEWNSLLIDRFDVRHLLTSLPRCKFRRDYLTRSPSPPLLPDGSSEADLYHERYLDLPPLTDERVQEQVHQIIARTATFVAQHGGQQKLF